MAQRIDLQRPDKEQTRSELTLGEIGRAWRHEPRGQLFTQALLDFFRSLSSSDTLRSYAFSVLQFWSWYQQEHGRFPTPDNVSRADAVEFDRWLRVHPAPLTKWRLEHDPARRMDLAIYQFVQGNPGTDIEAIRQQLGRFTEFTSYHEGKRYLAIEVPPKAGGLNRHLACLTKLHTLRRTPTMEQLRRETGHIVFSVPEGDFRYFIPVVAAPEGAERASTIATRLSALSSLWSYMMRSGENIAGRAEPLLRFNIWVEPLKLAQAQAPSHREVTRARKTPNLELFLRLLATTFLRTHGRLGAYAAAQAAFWGEPLPPATISVLPSFKDLRDRALLLLMAQTGARSREIHQLKRSSLAAGDPAVLTILGKRGKKRAIGLPPVVGEALRELDDKIRFLAEHQLRYSSTERAIGLLEPSAPLLPAVAYWGVNAGQPERGLTRPGISKVLLRRALRAGIEPDSPDFARAHPHGLRHLFAKIALETTPPHRVRAIMGHASLATTGRYAEEREPGLLVAEAFRGAVAPSGAPAFTPTRVVIGPEPEPQDVAVSAPTPRRTAPEPPPAPPPKVAHEPAIVRRVVEHVEEKREAPQVPRPPQLSTSRRLPAAAAVVAAAMAPGFDEFVAQIVTYRKKARHKALTDKQIADLARCSAMADVPLRNLCVIYEIGWGEEENRQALIPTGGRKPSKAKKNPALFEDEDEFEDDEEEEEEFEEFESGDIDIEAELSEMGKEKSGSAAERIERIERVEQGTTLYSEAGTDKVARIYSGKDSGLSWWTGTNGKLKPAMPVMSPDQVGECSSGAQGAVCTGLVELWRKWIKESPTKAEALVAWIGEALDTAAQMEAIVLSRGGSWAAADAPWLNTKSTKNGRKLKPRLVFREHLPQAIIAWFEKRGGSYRVSTGDPAGWIAKTAKPKPKGEPPPPWFYDEDPIFALPTSERRELVDWILALTGQQPVDTELRYGIDAATASRADVAKFVDSLCNFDQSIDALREDRIHHGPAYVSALWKLKSVDEFPEAGMVRRGFVELQRTARDLVRRGTNGKVTGFDAFDAIRRRVKKTETVLKKTQARIEKSSMGRIEPLEHLRIGTEDKETETEAEAEVEMLVAEQAAKERKLFIPNGSSPRETWALQLVKKYFGPDAANDPAIKLVAKCGRVPLSGFRELFQIKGGTIQHGDLFKAAFARQHGTHSECVARRIARRLWETRKRSPKSEFVTKPQHMVMLVNVMQAFKVPCTKAQEQELAYLAKYVDDPPGGIYNKWSRLRTASTEVALTEAEEIQREIAEEYEGRLASEVVAEKFRENPATSPAVPTPVHLLCAAMV